MTNFPMKPRREERCQPVTNQKTFPTRPETEHLKAELTNKEMRELNQVLDDQSRLVHAVQW